MSDATERPDDDEVDPLPEDAEIEPPAPGDPDESAEVLTPLPGMPSFHPIYGGLEVGAWPGNPERPILSAPPRGDVLLEASGRRAGYGALVILVAALTALMVVAVVLFRWDDPMLGFTPRLLASLLAAIVLLGGSYVLHRLISDVDVVLTTEGVARRGRGPEVWVPWQDVLRYRVDGELVTLECAGGALDVPPLPVSAREQLVQLLEARKVPRA